MKQKISSIPSLSPISVLHFIVELSIGGAQFALLRLLSHIDRQRFAPRVVCLYNGDGPVAQKIRAIGVPVTDLGMTAKYRLDALWRLYYLLRRSRPAILHTWMFHANIAGRIMGRLAGVPVIISSERTMGQEGFLRRWLNRSTAGLANNIVCVSQSVANFATGTIGLSSAQLVVIPNGVDLSEFLQLPAQRDARIKYHIPEDAVVIGAIGRPRPVKGYPYLIDAFARMVNASPSARLVFVGNGPDQQMLIDQVHSAGLENHTTFLGDQHDIPSLLPIFDILALPSLHEGMPNIAIEAMAAGLPVIATAVGGTPEVVADGVTGILVPPRDPQALSDALARLTQEPDLRQRMGNAGRERAYEHFDIQRTVQLTQALYERLYQP